jgi:hypothetical protein
MDQKFLDLLDAHGTPVKVGDRVRIMTIPDWLVHDLPDEEQDRLAEFDGQIVTVEEIDRFSYLWFKDPASGFCLRACEVRVVNAAPENS